MSTKYITQIFGFSRLMEEKWWLEVEVEDFGVLRRIPIAFDKKEDAESIKIGDRFII